MITWEELKKIDPVSVEADELEMAKRIITAVAQAKAILCVWKPQSRGKGKTEICELEDIRQTGKRFLVRMAVLGKFGKRTRVTTYASSILGVRALSDAELNRLSKAR